jgi:hypothetical protein
MMDAVREIGFPVRPDRLARLRAAWGPVETVPAP